MTQDDQNFFSSTEHRALITTTILTLATGTVVYHFAENWNWIDSIYFSVITLTTVGYGDLAPETDFGKIFTIFYVLTGVGLMFAFINSLYLQRTKRMKNPKPRKRGVD